MQFIEGIAKKFGRSASVAVVETVKEEAKTVGVNAIPVIAVIGLAIVGFKIFRSEAVVGQVGQAVSPLVPHLAHTTVTTNNFFFGEEIREEVLSRIIKGGN